ncbi:MAG: phytanoyl-CoA dioxygenase family protein [Planctomycetaceae bacterium]
MTVDSPQFAPQEVVDFERDGFVVVRGLADVAMVGRMRSVTDYGVRAQVGPIEYESDLQYPGAPASKGARGGETIRRLKQAHSRDYVFTEWLLKPELLGRLRQLLGPDIVCPLAHHNCIMTKHPEYSSETGWHQDIRYWSFARPDLVSVWLALVPETQGNGCLQVLPGSHRWPIAKNQLDAASFFRSDLPENQALIAERRFVEMQPGDVLFFHALTLHAASRNTTPETKYSVVFTFRSADNPPLAGSRSAESPELILR